MNTNDYTLSCPITVAVALLEQYHYQNGSDILLPELEKGESSGILQIYHLKDNDSVASLIFRPIEDNKCGLTLNVNDSLRYAFTLDDDKLGIIGGKALLATETSKECSLFCEDFIHYLESEQVLDDGRKPQLTNKGGKPRNPENTWAWFEVRVFKKDNNVVLNEWLKLRKKANRKTVDPKDLFRKSLDNLDKKYSDFL